MDIWVNEAGELIVDDAGAPIDCPDCPCGECGCVGTPPEEYALTIAGVTGCGACGDANGTHVLVRLADGPGTCRWGYSRVLTEQSPCIAAGSVDFNLQVSKSTGEMRLQITGPFYDATGGAFAGTFNSLGAYSDLFTATTCTTGLPVDLPVNLTAGLTGTTGWNGCWETHCGAASSVDPCDFSGATATLVAL